MPDVKEKGKKGRRVVVPEPEPPPKHGPEAEEAAEEAAGGPLLGVRIARMIRSRGLSISTAAEMMGMSRQQLWRILEGHVGNPGFLTVQSIVRSLGGRVKDLLVDGDLVEDPRRLRES